MKRLLFICLNLCWPLLTLAQDSLVYYKELTFSSPFEKKAFDDHFIHKKTDLFDLLMANGGAMNENRIQASKESFIGYLNAMGFEKMTSKKNDKKVKFVYDNIHKRFLQKYEEQNKFEQIFTGGNYNCVSASALYALAFDHLKLPYAIKEKPTHVYLIAFPRSESIMVETTTPLGGYYEMSTSFKQTYVKTLKDQKLISIQEFNNFDTNTLFDRYYFGQQEEISILQLIGLQYLNDGLYKMDEGQYENAHQQFEKAYLFHPSERIGYLLMVAATEAFQKRTEKDDNHIKLLTKLARYEKFGVTPDMIKGEFARVVLDLESQTGKKEQLRTYHEKLTTSLINQELKNEIDFIYYYESGRSLYNELKYKDALLNFEKALQAKPKYVDALNGFIGCLGQVLVAQNNNKEAIETLEKYGDLYPDLKTNNHYAIMLTTAYLIQFGQAYDMNKPAEGDRYKAAFESLRTENPELPVNQYLIGQAYSTAAVYYFRKGQTSKAKGIINKGLEISPNNPELLIRLEMLR